MRPSVGHTLCSWDANPSLQGHLGGTSPHILQDPRENPYGLQAGNVNEQGGLNVIQHGLSVIQHGLSVIQHGLSVIQ